MILVNFIKNSLNYLVNADKNYKNNLLLTFIYLLFLFFLYFSGLLHKYITPPYIVNGEIINFGDAKDVASWIKCSKMNIDIISDNSCTLRHKLTYGYIITFFPYGKFIGFLYQTLLPIFFIVSFLLVTVFFCKREKKLDLFLITLAIFNPHTLLLLERGNWDLLIYFSLILICLSNNSILRLIFIIINSLIKYYPILFFLIYLTDTNSNKSKTFNILLIFIIFFSFIFYFYEPTLKIIEENLYGASIRYNFSINALIQIIMKYLSNNKYFEILIYFSFILFFLNYLRLHLLSKDLRINFGLEEKLFLLSGSIILFSYILFSNFYYRDTFIVLCLPYLIKISNNYKNLNWILYLFIFRFIYNILTNNFIIWRKSFEYLLLRNVFDFCVIIVILSILIKFALNLFMINKSKGSIKSS